MAILECLAVPWPLPSAVRTYLPRRTERGNQGVAGRIANFPIGNCAPQIHRPGSFSRSARACPNIEPGGPDVGASPSLARLHGFFSQRTWRAPLTAPPDRLPETQPLASMRLHSLRGVWGLHLTPSRPLDHATQIVEGVRYLVLDTAADPPGTRPIQGYFAGWAAGRQSGHLASTGG